MANKNFIVKNGLEVGGTEVIDSSGNIDWARLKNRATATTGTAGNMSASDKSKLDNIENNANNYTHPTGDGNTHIPTGGSADQVLQYSSSGTATWATLPSSGGLSNIEVFTTNSTWNWTAAGQPSKVWVTIAGGGGEGWHPPQNYSGGGGGGGEFKWHEEIAVSGNVTVTIGAGGSGSGGTSSFGSLTAVGGSAGGPDWGGPGGGTTGMKGQGSSNANGIQGGMGGGSFGPPASGSTGVGEDGIYGSGGGGGISGRGSGGNGIVIVMY